MSTSGSDEPGRGADEPPECIDCGACCFSNLPEYVRVFGVDHDRMDERAAALTEFEGNRCFMKMRDGRCSALSIDAERGQFLCTIYPMRSDVCRSLERGSGQCRADRHEKGERPRRALAVLRGQDAAASGDGGVYSNPSNRTRKSSE